MLPFVEVGGLRVDLYWAFILLGVTVAGSLMLGRYAKQGYAPAKLLPAFLLSAAGGALGAFLFRGGLAAAYGFLQNGAWRWEGGSSILGALLGALLGLAAACRLFHLPLWKTVDYAAAYFPLGQFFGRIGCQCAGCCFGRPTGSTLGVYLPDHDGDWQVRYPTQLWAAGFDLLLFLFMRRLLEHWEAMPAARRPPEGALALIYLALFAAKRFVMEFFRGETTPWLGWITGGQAWSGLYFVLAVGGLAWLLRRGGFEMEQGETKPAAQ